MLNNKLKIAAVVIMTFLALTGCSRNVAKENDQPLEIEAVAVKTEKVVADSVYESVYSIGEIKAADSYQVNAMANGKVVEVNVEVGDQVEKGDVLFKIETEDYEVDKNSKLTQALNGVTQAKNSLDNASKQYEDTKKLYNAGVSSKSQLDGAKLSYDNAKISYNNALTSYNTTKHTYDSMKDNYEITAPVSGIVTSSTIINDMFATTQHGMVVEVVDQYKITTNIPSKNINSIAKDQNVEVYVPTLERTFKGRVASVSLNGNIGTYPVEVVLEESTELLRTGMYSELWIQTGDSSEGLWIPSKALIQENGQSFVYTVEEGFAKKIIVDVLSLRGNQTAIKSDLTSNDRLITFGKEYVMDGSKVNVQ